MQTHMSIVKKKHKKVYKGKVLSMCENYILKVQKKENVQPELIDEFHHQTTTISIHLLSDDVDQK